VVVVPKDKAAEVLAMAQEIDQRELEQAKLIIASGSLKEGLAKYGRI
jgi:regulator of RNase E activity RraA